MCGPANAMMLDPTWAYGLALLMAGFLLWHLLSGRVPISQARRHRRDSPRLYWFQILVLAGFYTLTAILLILDDRRAMLIFWGGMLICGLPALITEGLPRLARGNVPGSDDRAGRFSIRVTIVLFTLLALALIAWTLLDIARPPW